MKNEIIVKGIAAAPGISIGHAFIFKKDTPYIEERTIEAKDIKEEIDRLKRAVDRSEHELNKILTFAQQKLGEAKAKILEAQIMILQDPVLFDTVYKRIKKENKNAEFIINDEIGKYANMMLAASDDYMHERAHDVEDLKFRIIRNLQQEKLFSRLEGSPIIIGHSLTPTDTVILSRNNILGYATDLGGVTSHTALLSRSLKIPAVVGLNGITRTANTGDLIVLDGYSGVVIVHPTPETIKKYEIKRIHFAKFESHLAELKGLPAVTLDGKTIELSANIEFQEEIEYVTLQGSQGVGLYRTESILIDRMDFPNEDEQCKEYKKIASGLFPQKIIMRTFDIGGDKIVPGMAEENNPALGWRGIRVMLDKPDLFMNQLRAILRASSRKNVAIMFPMITSLWEVRKAKEYLDKAKQELRERKIRFDEKIQCGVMIEVPAAALTAEQIAAEVDFLSIGTNDLTQYTLAVDRTNNLVSDLYHEYEPALIVLIKHIINAGHHKGKWVGVCGEMASKPTAVPLLIGLGIDELSVVPFILPEIKKIIRSLSYTETRELARKALAAPTANEIEKMLCDFLKIHCPDIPADDDNMNNL